MQHLDVRWPASALDSVTLIDTPGLASLNDENSRRTREFLDHDGDFYDAYLERPEIVRLAVWARLERVPTGDLLTAVADEVATKTAMVRSAQDAGLVDPELDPRDVYPMVIGLSLAWSPASPTMCVNAYPMRSR